MVDFDEVGLRGAGGGDGGGGAGDVAVFASLFGAGCGAAARRFGLGWCWRGGPALFDERLGLARYAHFAGRRWRAADDAADSGYSRWDWGFLFFDAHEAHGGERWCCGRIECSSPHERWRGGGVRMQ